MLDKIQFLLSMQIIGLCVLGGIMMLLRSFGNRARLILQEYDYVGFDGCNQNFR